MTPLKIAGYLAHAKTAGYQRRVSEARRLIADHPGYSVACSWGKDSLCVLHMALDVHGTVSAIHGRYSENEELPDIPNVRDAFLSRHRGVAYQEVGVWGDWEVYEMAGRFFLHPETKEERAILAEWKFCLVDAMDEAAIRMGASGKLIGLAAHEGRARAMNIAVRGVSYKTAKEALPKALPIAKWRPEDVWAYMLTNDLPMLRAYTDATDPERARSEFAFATIGGDAADAIRRHGAWMEWERVYPELWAKWVARWPEMARYK